LSYKPLWSITAEGEAGAERKRRGGGGEESDLHGTPSGCCPHYAGHT
jgi:hypothetical protein